MVDIVLTSAQLDTLRKSNGRVRLLTPEGELECVVHTDESGAEKPVLSREDTIEALRRLSTMDGNLISTDELLNRMKNRFAS